MATVSGLVFAIRHARLAGISLLPSTSTTRPSPSSPSPSQRSSVACCCCCCCPLFCCRPAASADFVFFSLSIHSHINFADNPRSRRCGFRLIPPHPPPPLLPPPPSTAPNLTITRRRQPVHSGTRAPPRTGCGPLAASQVGTTANKRKSQILKSTTPRLAVRIRVSTVRNDKGFTPRVPTADRRPHATRLRVSLDITTIESVRITARSRSSRRGRFRCRLACRSAGRSSVG